MLNTSKLCTEFETQFGQPPNMAWFAPGRVNLIGEHIDYLGGTVLPFAIDHGTTVMLAPNGTRQCRLLSLEHGPGVARSLWNIKKTGHWTDHILGVVNQVRAEKTPVLGFDMLIASDLVEGSGLSSSSALCVAAYCAITQLFSGQAPQAFLATTAARNVERVFMGVQCGIMDQFVITHAKADFAVLLNCAELSHRHIPFLLKGHKLLVINSKKPRQLAHSAYNQRVAECEKALAFINQNLAKTIDWPTVGIENLKSISNPILLKRGRHVVSEMARVQRTVAALKQNDLASVGAILNESHASLRDDYEVSCPEVDFLVSTCQNTEGCLGARMTGAGFGGCVIALIKDNSQDLMLSAINQNYNALFGLTADVFEARPSDGARVLAI